MGSLAPFPELIVDDAHLNRRSNHSFEVQARVAKTG